MRIPINIPSALLTFSFLLIVFPSLSVQSEEIDLSQYQQVRYISVTTGSDTTGDGSRTSPWKTPYFGLGQISDASTTQRYAVLIASGTYTHYWTSGLYMRPYIDVYGGYDCNQWNRASTTEESVLLGSEDYVAGMGSYCTMDGFVIKSTSKYFALGISSEHTTGGIIRNCTFTNNRLGSIDNWHSSSLTIDRCIFYNNYFFPGTSAIICENDTNTIISNCLIYRNTSDDYQAGVTCIDASPTVVNCTIVDNDGCAITCDGNSKPEIINCILNNRGDEISGGKPTVSYSCVQGDWTGIGNINAIPSFVDPDQDNYHLANGSPCINSASAAIAPPSDLAGIPRPLGSGADMGAYESPATYTQGTVSEYIPKHLFVRSDAPEGGDGQSWASAYNTITKALDQVYGEDELWVSGGTYHESVILEPSMTLFGGFAGTEANLSERNWSANPTIIDATGLKKSTVVGAEFARLNGVHITNSNTAYGAGIFCNGCSPSIDNCNIYHNYCEYARGAVYCNNASPAVTNCIIAHNTSEYNDGAAISGYYASPTFNHCTVYGNTGGTGYAIKFTGNSYPVITNSIVLNPGPDISASHIQISYSCLHGSWEGTGNIACPPQMVNPDEGDFHLLDGSPCIGRATNTIGLETDYEGNLRSLGSGPDMGAYEAPASYTQGSTTVTPQRLYVNSLATEGGDGSSWVKAFNSIQESVDASWPGDEIWVAEGTYNEAVFLEVSVSMYGGFSGVESGLSERHWKEHPTIIDATDLDSQVVDTSDGCILDGFTITGGVQSGVYCNDSSVRIANCIVTGNAVSGYTYAYGGGITGMAASLEVTDCTITNNTGNQGGGGLSCQNSTVKVSGCSIIGNSSLRSGGGLFCYNSVLTVMDCIITSNNIGSKSGYRGIIQSYGGGGICCGTSTIIIEGCNISDNFSRMRAGGFACYCSDVTMRDCTVQGNTNLLADGAGIYLDKSNGVIERISVINNAVTSTSYHGGGLYCSYSPLKISNCTFSGNTRDGVHIYRSAVEMDQCTFSANTVTSIHCLYTPGPTLDHCTISGTNGVSLYCEGCPAVVSDCTFTGNINTNTDEDFGTIYCKDSDSFSIKNSLITKNTAVYGGAFYIKWSEPTISGCNIIDNTATEQGGGLYLHIENPLLENCVLRGNTAKQGGGIYSYYGVLSMYNCTLFGNQAVGEDNPAGGIYCFRGKQNIYNSILWNDLPTEIVTYGSSGQIMKYCDVEGGITGPTNIDVDPLFVDATNGDFHLQGSSPCIGKGIGPELDSLVPLFDIDNDARSGKTCDIGADEYIGPTSVVDWFSY